MQPKKEKKKKKRKKEGKNERMKERKIMEGTALNWMKSTLNMMYWVSGRTNGSLETN